MERCLDCLDDGRVVFVEVVSTETEVRPDEETDGWVGVMVPCFGTLSYLGELMFVMLEGAHKCFQMLVLCITGYVAVVH